MDDALLRLLIERAAERRDDAARTAAQARRDRDAAHRTLDTLKGYREESLQRAPVRTGQSVGVDHLRVVGGFDDRLVAAIHQQHHQHAQRAADARHHDLELAERQRRLKALETLALRRARGERQREARRDQRALDEYATHLAARREPGKDPT